jgi:predicted Fe-S protein YdhL (DUF1289 family)
MSDGEPQSPCIAVCVLDEQDICIGCYRSAVEIADWFMASREAKLDILRSSYARMLASSDVRLE